MRGITATGCGGSTPFRMSAAALAAAAVFAVPSPATANQADKDTVTALWNTFLELCGAVANDPVGTIADPVVLDGYRHTLAVQNESGNRVFVSHVASDDGLGVASEYSVLNAGKMAVLDCTVSYNVQANLDVARVGEYARELLEADGSMTLVGGANTVQNATGFFSSASLAGVSDSFTVEGAFPGSDLAVVATFETVTFFFALIGSIELPS